MKYVNLSAELKIPGVLASLYTVLNTTKMLFKIISFHGTNGAFSKITKKKLFFSFVSSYSHLQNHLHWE